MTIHQLFFLRLLVIPLLPPRPRPLENRTAGGAVRGTGRVRSDHGSHAGRRHPPHPPRPAQDDRWNNHHEDQNWKHDDQRRFSLLPIGRRRHRCRRCDVTIELRNDVHHWVGEVDGRAPAQVVAPPNDVYDVTVEYPIDEGEEAAVAVELVAFQVDGFEGGGEKIEKLGGNHRDVVVGQVEVLEVGQDSSDV